MGNHTVNQEEKVEKKKFVKGAAGIETITSTKVMAIQNNTPHKLQIIETNNQGINNLPFMIEEGQIVNDTQKEVTIKAEVIHKNILQKEKMQKQH